MKQRKDGRRAVYQSFAMVMQFGLNMIVPIGMMSALGIWLDGKLGTSFLTIVLFMVGAVAGGQNIYRVAKNICNDGKQLPFTVGSARDSDAFSASRSETEDAEMSGLCSFCEHKKQEEGALNEGGYDRSIEKEK